MKMFNLYFPETETEKENLKNVVSPVSPVLVYWNEEFHLLANGNFENYHIKVKNENEIPKEEQDGILAAVRKLADDVKFINTRVEKIEGIFSPTILSGKEKEKVEADWESTKT